MHITLAIAVLGFLLTLVTGWWVPLAITFVCAGLFCLISVRNALNWLLPPIR